MEKSQFYSKTLSKIAFFLSVIIYGTLAFIEAKQIDFYTCIFLFTKIIPYSLIIGFLGFFKSTSSFSISKILLADVTAIVDITRSIVIIIKLINICIV